MSLTESCSKRCGACQEFRITRVDDTPFGVKMDSSGKVLRQGVCSEPYGLLLGVRDEEAVCKADLLPSSKDASSIV